MRQLVLLVRLLVFEPSSGDLPLDLGLDLGRVRDSVVGEDPHEVGDGYYRKDRVHHLLSRNRALLQLILQVTTNLLARQVESDPF